MKNLKKVSRFCPKVPFFSYKCHYINFVICCKKAFFCCPFLPSYQDVSDLNSQNKKEKWKLIQLLKRKKGQKAENFFPFCLQMLKAFKIINKMEIFVLRYEGVRKESGRWKVFLVFLTRFHSLSFFDI